MVTRLEVSPKDEGLLGPLRRAKLLRLSKDCRKCWSHIARIVLVSKGQSVASGDKSPPVLDPKNPASKPHGTTKDQVSNMEGEGQAQIQGQEPPADIDVAA